MKQLIRRSGVLAVTLLWAFVWACPGGFLEALSNLGINFPISSMFDIWPMVLAIPGAFAGVLFSAALWSADGERRLDEWSLLRLGVCGGIIGLIPGVLAAVTGFGDHAYPAVWPRAAITVALATILGVAAAIVTALVFRFAAQEDARITAGA